MLFCRSIMVHNVSFHFTQTSWMGGLAATHPFRCISSQPVFTLTHKLDGTEATHSVSWRQYIASISIPYIAKYRFHNWIVVCASKHDQLDQRKAKCWRCVKSWYFWSRWCPRELLRACYGETLILTALLPLLVRNADAHCPQNTPPPAISGSSLRYHARWDAKSWFRKPRCCCPHYRLQWIFVCEL